MVHSAEGKKLREHLRAGALQFGFKVTSLSVIYVGNFSMYWDAPNHSCLCKETPGKNKPT